MRTSARSTIAALAFLAGMGAVSSASAQDTATPPTLAPDAQITIAPTPPEGKTGEPDTTLPAAPAEAPPPRPRKKGVVLEQTAGVLGFIGQFRHVAPPGYWMHMQLGYEIFKWLMVFGSGELAFTSTGVSQGPSNVMAFPIYGFGGGARVTIHVTDRFAFFLQGEGGALTAYVPHDSLEILGYRDAEGLNGQVGGRLGLEWYQLDRHLALTAEGGVRDAFGFERVVGGADLPLMWDASGGLRYTF